MDFSKMKKEEAREFLAYNGVQETSQDERTVLMRAAAFYRERANLPNFGGTQFTLVFLALDRAARFPSTNKYTMQQILNLTPEQLQLFGNYYQFDVTTPYAKQFLWRILELQGNAIEQLVNIQPIQPQIVPQIQPLIPAPAPQPTIQPYVQPIQPHIQPIIPAIQPSINPIVMSPVKLNSPTQPLQQGFGYLQNSPIQPGVNIQPMSPGRVTIGYTDTQVDDTNNMVNATSYSDEFKKIFMNENQVRQHYAVTPFNAPNRYDVNATYNLTDVTDRTDHYLQSFQNIQRAAYVTPDSIFAASAFKKIEPYKNIDVQRTVQKRADYLKMLNSLIPDSLKDNLVIAGGCVLKYFLLPVADNDSDIDIFIVGTERPELILIEYMDFLTKNTKFVLGKRSPLAVTIYHRDDMKAPISIILRRYRSPSEIMSGFDLDASCFCFYKGRIWTSFRGDYALRNRTNTVDITRISPSYNYRLLKYAMKKGFRVQVPGLYKNNRMKDIILDKFTRLQNRDNTVNYYGCLGLYTLLMMEVSSMTNKNNEYQKAMVRNMSDYDTTIREVLYQSGDDEIASIVSGYNKLGTKDEESMYFEGKPEIDPRKRKSIYYTKSPVLLLQDNALQGKVLPVKPVFITENPGQQGYYTGSFFPIMTTWEQWRDPEDCVAALKHPVYNTTDRTATIFSKFDTLPIN